MRTAIRALVEGLAPFDEAEAAHRVDALEWLDRGASIFRTAKPATPPKHLVSYCVLVEPEAEQILLVDHRDAERWLPTGGHVEVDEHPADAARREILEELQVAPPFHPAIGPSPLMVTVTRTQGRSAPHTDVSLWFVFAGPADSVLVPDESEFAATRWWPFDDVRADGPIAFDPNLPRFVAKLRAHVTADRILRSRPD